MLLVLLFLLWEVWDVIPKRLLMMVMIGRGYCMYGVLGCRVMTMVLKGKDGEFWSYGQLGRGSSWDKEQVIENKKNKDFFITFFPASPPPPSAAPSAPLTVLRCLLLVSCLRPLGLQSLHWAKGSWGIHQCASVIHPAISH